MVAQPELSMTRDDTDDAADHAFPRDERARAREDGPWRARLGGEVVIARLERADSAWSRLRGLLGRAGLDRDQALWIDPCTSIHMFFMRFPLDVVFLDADHQVVRVHEDVRPWRLARGGKFARSVLELPTGTIAHFNVRVGDRFVLDR